MYIPKYFKPEELVPPDIFEKRGDKSIELIDERVLFTLDRLRETFGTCTVNNWSYGGAYSQSGLRTPDSEDFSPTSQHTFGRAMDCKFKDVPADKVREQVIENKFLFPYITFIEDDISWFHFDVRNCQRIILWSPKTGDSYVA